MKSQGNLLRAVTLLAMALLAGYPLFAVRAPMHEDKLERWKLGTSVGGLRPWTMDMSHLGETYRLRRTMKKRQLRATSLPSAWDSREHGWVTSVKNQGAYGTCWTFSTMAALESGLLKEGRGTFDLSENHMATHDVGFTWGFSSGGNNQMATALVASWRDPILDALDKYPNPNAHVTAPAVLHVQNVMWLPERSGVTNAVLDTLLKELVMNNGAIGIGYLHCKKCYDTNLGSHYIPDDSYYNWYTDGGHAVTLVGWDDNYPSNNFNVVPPSNGAFLCKNSWGASEGTNGYLWVSYYDKYFCFLPSAVFPSPGATNNYGKVYQYDPCGQVEEWNVYLNQADQARGGKENWCANMFTSTSTGIVAAVGFYAISAGTEYKLRVYANCTGVPSSGKLVSEQTGTTDYAGFITLPLATPVPIVSCAERFAVVMHLETPNNAYPLPVTCDHYEDNELFCTNIAHAGESFLSSNGVDWIDFQDYPLANRSENVCIKAYTRYGADGEEVHLITSASPADSRITVQSEETHMFSVTVDDAAATYEWAVDGTIQAAKESTFAYAFSPGNHGTHTVSCRVVSTGGAEIRYWTVVVTALLHVDAASTVTEPDGSLAKPYPSIIQALATAVLGDEVVVAPGTYAGNVMPTVNILIRSAEGPRKTFIDADDSSRCYTGSLAPKAVLSGFTLKNGNARYGGGAYEGIISNCVITACCANFGGGAYASTLLHCTLYDNVVYSGYGGGVFGGCVVQDSIIHENYYTDGYGYYELENWVSWSSDTFTYTCTSPLPSGDGNIVADPLFLDAVNGDFRLKATSPCLDAASDGGNMGALQGAGLTPFTIIITTTHGGRVSPSGNVTVALGEDLTITAQEDHPFLYFVTNDVRVASEGSVFTWKNITENGSITAEFKSVDFYVDARNGSDANNGWSGACSKATLQAAVTAASDGEKIFVAPGTYDGITNYRLDLQIVATGNPADTIITGGGIKRCLDDYGTATLQGFTLANGFADNDYGGGAYYGTLVACVVSNCYASVGGGVSCVTLTNCLITANRAQMNGGGAHESLLVNCTVAKNSAGQYGGGAFLQTNGGAVNTLVAENLSDSGSAYGNDVYGNLYWSMVASLSDADAYFVDSANDDFRLRVDSPAVDAGTNALIQAVCDLVGNPRIFGDKVDIGAFERQCGSAIPFTAQDIPHAQMQITENYIGEAHPAGYVWSNDIVQVVYTAENGYYFEDGAAVFTNRMDTAKNPAVSAGVSDPGLPEVKVGIVAQRYPWRGMLDVQYKARSVPLGTKMAVIVATEENVRTNDLIITQNGINWTSFDLISNFGRIQTNTAKVRLRLK